MNRDNCVPRQGAGGVMILKPIILSLGAWDGADGNGPLSSAGLDKWNFEALRIFSRVSVKRTAFARRAGKVIVSMNSNVERSGIEDRTGGFECW